MWTSPEELLTISESVVWIYRLSPRKLRRIVVPTTEISVGESRVRFLTKAYWQEDRRAIFVSQPTGLYFITLFPEIRAQRLSLNPQNALNPTLDNTLGAGMLNGQPAVMSRKYIWELSSAGTPLRERKVPRWPLSSYGFQPEIYVGGSRIWLYTPREIWSWNPQDPSSENWMLHTSTVRNINQILMFGRQLMIQTPYTLIAMGLGGEVERTIPVSSVRQITHMQLMNPLHVYGFDDGRVEVYDSRKQTMRYFELPSLKDRLSSGADSAKLGDLAVSTDAQNIATLRQGELRLYKIAGI